MGVLLGLTLLYLLSSPLWATEWSTYLEVDSFTHSEPVTVKGYLNDWDSPFFGGSNAITDTRIESGARYGAWEISLLQRVDYSIHSDLNTSLFYYQSKHKQPLVPRRNYRLSIDAHHYAGDALRLGYRTSLSPSATLRFSSALFRANQVRSTRLRGNAQAITTQDYDFEFQLDEYYSANNLLHRELNSRPQGKGGWIELDLEWIPLPDWTVQLQVRDLLGRVYWDDVQYTHADAYSVAGANKNYDEEGYVQYNPILSGRDSTIDWVEHLDSRAILELKWPLVIPSMRGKLSGIGRYRSTKYKDFLEVGVNYHSTAYQSWLLRLDPDNKVVTAGVEWPWGEVVIGTDSRDLDLATTLILSARVEIEL